jgi:nucleoside-diphosphate-sugar epimerase
MRLLITGNLGYIGTELVNLAKGKGHFVRGLDSGFYKDNLLYQPQASADQQIIADIRDVDLKVLEDVDAVIHLAALSNDPICELDPSLTFEINHVAAVKMARMTKNLGIERFVFASTASVYGVASTTVSETSPVNPLTAYAKSKYLAEQELFELADDSFTVVAFRPATAYGLGARLRTDIVLNNLCAWAHCDGKIAIMSDGTPLRPAAHVNDIATAFLAAALCPKEIVQREVFNLGRNQDNYSIRQMAEMVQSFVPHCELVFTGEHADSRSYAINFDKISERLGDFATLRTTLQSGIKELIEGYKCNRLTRDDFIRGRYTRLATLKEKIAAGEIKEDLRK